MQEDRLQCSMQDWKHDFFLPDGKNSRLSQIINTSTFGRLTPDGNEGVGVKIGFLEHAYDTKYYMIEQVNGHISAIHDDRIEITEFTGCSAHLTWMS